ncbi:MAG: GIY-YIG nuclease family protein [Betaproteobacteria bacterium]|nr:GIY-YIG nuclease family protein [Betaproteobacteria bacterium]
MLLPFLHERIAVIDLETTGTAATSDGITEIGIVRIERGEVVEEWSSLVNPETTIPPEIQALTGITDAMVRDAPVFSQLADEVLSRLNGHLFVAHNARFDYGFIKNAFRRLGVPFTAEVLCTVRLSRKLYPQYAQHNLDTLISRHSLSTEGRHRALGDARLAWQFMLTAAREHPAEDVMAATKSLLKMPSLPPQLDADALKALPDGPGVYVFYGINDLPIYIGKSVNLRDRVRSHFSSDHRNSNDVRLSMEIRRIEHEETAGELGALLRESQLIKSSKPLRNLRLRRNAQMVFIKLTDLGAPLEIIKLEDADLENATGLFGPFPAKPRAKEMLTRLAAENGLCWIAIGTQSIDGPCFARQIKRCHGFCVGVETMAAHNARLATALAEFAFPAWPFDGPIAVRETHPDHGWQRAHVFHRWRYYGSAKTEAEMHELAEIRSEVEFDADIFRLIVKRLAQGGEGIVRLKSATRGDT